MKIRPFVLTAIVLLVLFTMRPGYAGPVPGINQPGHDIHPDRLIAVSLEEYQVFLKKNPPLDRLYVKGKTGYFLVTEREKQTVEAGGLTVLEEKKLPDKDLNRTHMSSNGEYHSYNETRVVLEDLVSRFPNRAQLINLGQTEEGRDLLMIKISDNVSANEEQIEPNVYINGCHHAREWISVEVPLLFARYLLENYDGNARIRQIVNRSQIFIMPVVNPDGLEYSIHTYRLWRKNRRYNGNFSWGVDLNRNYGYKWGINDFGSSPNPWSNVYRGQSPHSENETRALHQYMRDHPPAGAIAYHNYSQIILMPWGYTDEPPEDIDQLTEIAAGMSDRMAAVNGNRYDYGGNDLLYGTNGSFVDWVYGTFKVPAYTIELPPMDVPHGAFFTPESLIESAFNENLPALLYFAEYFIENHVAGPIVDKKSPRPTPVQY